MASRELTLIAQDTSRYGCDFGDGHYLLPELLEAVSAIDGVHWVRVLYCYPDSTDDRLLDAIARLPKVAPYLDLPLQRIDDDLLRRMNRRGSADWIKSRIAECRKRGILVRTTMIVGFPGEADAQFRHAARLRPRGEVRAPRRVHLLRRGGHARRADAGVRDPQEVKNALVRRPADDAPAGDLHDFNESRVGTTCEVLVEGFDEETGRFYGRSILEAPESDGCIWLEGED